LGKQKDQAMTHTLQVHYGYAGFQWLQQLLIAVLTSPLEIGPAALVGSLDAPPPLYDFSFAKAFKVSCYWWLIIGANLLSVLIKASRTCMPFVGS